MDDPSPISDSSRAARWLGRAADARVLVVGDVMLDRYLTGAVDRISPEAPVPVLRVEAEHAAPGGAANVAAGIAALGAACDLVSVVGADVDAEELTTLLGRSAGVRLDLLQDPERPTTVKTRVLARHQQMLRVDRESTGPLPKSVRERVKRHVLDRLEEASAVALVDYDKGVLGADWVAEILDAAGRRGVPAVVDPKLRNFFSFRGAFLFKPNGRELAAAIGAERPPRDPVELAAVRERLGCRHLLVTLGERGMTLLAEGASTLRHIPSRAREVYDVSGAGDTVTAVLAVLLGAGADVGEAAVLANVAAGVEVSHLGAVPVRVEELLAAVQELNEGPAAPGAPRGG
ncbi:MAG: PfkB family carbohydrate kinase [Candidatus Palauibacterales bacterium]|nr:PfkB family carbohydrate kinase [Candidatus Palauibacterales bacterium]MDP2584602.1 PfkB family carbohydrate kinase [Candidatus Palauibacterales bacterium]